MPLSDQGNGFIIMRTDGDKNSPIREIYINTVSPTAPAPVEPIAPPVETVQYFDDVVDTTFPRAVSLKNLLPLEMETGSGGGWTGSPTITFGSVDQFLYGGQSLKITSTLDGNIGITSGLSGNVLVPGVTYSFGASVKYGDLRTGNAYIRGDTKDATGLHIGDTGISTIYPANSTGWAHVGRTFTAAAGVSQLTLVAHIELLIGQTAYWDNFWLLEGIHAPGSYVPDVSSSTAKTWTQLVTLSATSPIIANHRGAGMHLAKENALSSIDFANNIGMDDRMILDGGDIRLTSDGALVNSSPSTTGSWADQDLTVSAITEATFKTLKYRDFPLSLGTVSTETGNTIREWLTKAKTVNRFTTVELKVAGDAPQKLTNLIIELGMQNQVIVQSADPTSLVSAKNAGIAVSLFQSDTNNIGFPAILTCIDGKAPDMLNFRRDGAPGNDNTWISSAIQAGIKLQTDITNRRHTLATEVARVKNLGGTLTFVPSNDPFYLLGKNSVLTNDRFLTQNWEHGLLKSPDSTSAPRIGDGRLSFHSSNSQYTLMGMFTGQRCWTQMEYNLTFDALDNETTRWGGVFFAFANDQNFHDGKVHHPCLSFLMSQNGQMRIFNRTSSSSTTRVASNNHSEGTKSSTTLNALTTGQTVRIRIENFVDEVGNFTGQTRVTRLDTGQWIMTALGDAPIRGPHMNIGKNGTTGSRLSFSKFSLVYPNSNTESGATLDYIWTGAITENSATIVTETAGAASVKLNYSTSSTLTGPSTTTLVSTGIHGETKHTISGLSPDTKYYYEVEADGKKFQGGSFKTLPVAGTTKSFSFGFGSCWKKSTDADPITFDRVRARNPLMFLEIGDFYYADTNTTDAELYHNNYDALTNGSARSRSFLANVPTLYTWSDHDFCGGGSHSGRIGASTADSVYRLRVPSHPLPTTGVYQTWVVGRCRFIMLDLRRLRSSPGAVDDANKKMMGDTQEQWFYSTITNSTEPMIFVISEVPWAWNGGTLDDHWGSYRTEANRIATWLNGNLGTKKLVFLSGDMHAVAYDDGTNGLGYPNWAAAPIGHVGTIKAGPWSGGTFNPSLNQYGYVEVTDDSSTISCKFTGYRADTDVALTTHTISVAAAVSPTGTPVPSDTLAPSDTLVPNG